MIEQDLGFVGAALQVANNVSSHAVDVFGSRAGGGHVFRLRPLVPDCGPWFDLLAGY
jgi:hypothetical protein